MLTSQLLVCFVIIPLHQLIILQAAQLIKESRERISRVINCGEDEITFMSGQFITIKIIV